MTRILRTLIQLAVPTSIFFFTSASSCDAGDRALTGACPEDEVCDPATEDGLHFRGARFAESLFDFGDLKTLAVGGTQQVRIFEVDDRGRHVPLALAFDAEISDGVAVVEAQHDSAIVLRGDAEAAGFLRIQAADSGALFDRTTIAARAIGEIRLEPTFDVAFDARDSFLYAPGAPGVVRLAATPDGGRLVDESATISGPGITQHAWDAFSIGDLAPGTHALEVRAGDRGATTVTFEVGHADSLHRTIGSDSVLREGRGWVCFAARAGDRGVHVAWRFETDNATGEQIGLNGCVNLEHTGGDTVTVRAFADGLTTSVTMNVVEKRQVPRLEDVAARTLRPFAARDTAGDRAALH